MPHVNKSQLIEGRVHMPSPVRFASHGSPHADLMGVLFIYRLNTPGVHVADNTTLRLDPDNNLQPDAMLLIDPSLGGKARLSEDDYIEGAPELVVEIASSSVAIDVHEKRNAYRRNGVQEYLVWRVEDEALDFYQLVEQDYVRLAPDEQGVVRSVVFPGLWLDVVALVGRDLPRVLATLQQGLASNEHGAFVARTSARSTST